MAVAVYFYELFGEKTLSTLDVLSHIWSVENYAQQDGYHPEVVKKYSKVKTEPQTKPSIKSQVAEQVSDQPSDHVYYRNCSEARAAGAAPIYREGPGYREALDQDNDGIACE